MRSSWKSSSRDLSTLNFYSARKAMPSGEHNAPLDYMRRVHAEMLDSFDEELEMEVDDEHMNDLVAEAT